MTGVLIGVVGPSGVGKDTLMHALVEASPDLALVRRFITRPAELGGEDFTSVSEDAFDGLCADGAFCVHWRAHGLRYGIPDEVRLRVGKGERLLVNLSRNVLSDVAAVFPDFMVLNVTAAPETLASRLKGRGRETADDIARRLARSVRPIPDGVKVYAISNDGSLNEAVDAALAVLHPVSA